MRFIYSFIFTLIAPLLLLRMWFRGRKAPAYRLRWSERLALQSIPDCARNGIVIHCVSVGETMAAVPLIKAIKASYPDKPVTVTSTTPTGSDTVLRIFGDSVYHCYLPFDTPGAMSRFFRRLKPELLVVMETELWPNLLRYAAISGCKTILANARLSENSFNGYKKVSKMSAQMMKDLALVAAHNETDGERFKGLGLAAEKLSVTGSIKFEVNVSEQLLVQQKELKLEWGVSRPIITAGSTHAGEDELLLEAVTKLPKGNGRPLLVLVPRHPERFNNVETLIKRVGLTVVKRSSGEKPDLDTDVFLLDSMGELMLFYGVADIAIVGGSLEKGLGGHNPLEPSALKVPVVTGPYVKNFKRIYQQLIERKAAFMINDVDELVSVLNTLLNDKSLRKQTGERAAAVVEENKGALSRLTSLILSFSGSTE